MKKSLLVIIVFSLSISACNDDSSEIVLADGEPRVKQVAFYEVSTQEDITYGEGLSHESLNSANANAIPLKLDVYAPINDENNRPVFMFIHGGAFQNGSKQQYAIINIANYYASRGWVFVSIDYRLSGDNGTVPEEWSQFAASLPVSEDDKASFNAMYPALRDAKAAMRWLIANKDQFKINPDYITVGGASAGANISKALAVSNFDDFTTEISLETDPTLSTTNLGQEYQIQVIIDFWGGQSVTDAYKAIYGQELFDIEDPILYKAHGTADQTVPFSSALDLLDIYETIGVEMKLDTLIGIGHGNFDATLNGKRLEELAFDFIVSNQNLIVE